MLDLSTKIKQKYVVKHKISMNVCFNAYFLFAEKRVFLLGMKFNVQPADNKSLTPVRDKKSQIKVGNLAIYLYLYS